MRTAILRVEKPFSEWATQEKRNWVRLDKQVLKNKLIMDTGLCAAVTLGQLIMHTGLWAVATLVSLSC